VQPLCSKPDDALIHGEISPSYTTLIFETFLENSNHASISSAG